MVSRGSLDLNFVRRGRASKNWMMDRNFSRPSGSLSTGAGGPMGVLGIRAVELLVGVYYMSKWWWRSS